MRLLLLSLFVLSFSLSSFSQDSKNYSENNRLKTPFGVSYKLGGIIYTGFVVDYFITPNIKAEIDFMPIKRKEFFGVGGGLEYHFYGQETNRKWTPYSGFKAGYFEVFFVNYTELINFYIPFGYQYISNNNFNFSVDIGVFHERNQGNFESRINTYPMLSTKIGFRFDI